MTSTNDLRTRIAAVVADYHQRWGMRCECGADHAHADGLADAVIAELGMEREHWQYGDGHTMGVRYRYVTGWEVDE